MAFKFKRGDVIKAAGMVGVIRDVLASTQETGNECVYVSFVHNLGNSRQYDMLELTPENDQGTGEWRLATWEEWRMAHKKKHEHLANVSLSMASCSKNFSGDGLPQ